MICYRLDESIRILDLYNSPNSEQILHLPSLHQEVVGPSLSYKKSMFTLLNYGDQILSCLYTVGKQGKEDYLLAFNVKPGTSPPCELLVCSPVKYPRKPFTRNDGSYLCYGTYSTGAAPCYRVWTISVFSLLTGNARPEMVQLGNLMGSTIGVDICFEIFNGYFYAVSSKVCSELDRVDWTSSYHCIRFPLKDANQQKLQVNDNLWRRDYTEGPIDTTFTDLSLQLDDESGEILIVEGRCEWQCGSRSSRRTYYMQPVVFPNAQGFQEMNMLQMGDYQDYHARQVSITNFKDHGQVEDRRTTGSHRYRPPRHVHPIDDNLWSKNYCALPATNLRYFTSLGGLFLDLVQIPQERPRDNECRRPPKVRLHIETRKLGAPTRNEEGLLTQPETEPATGMKRAGSEEVWIKQGPFIWPPTPPSNSAPDRHLEALYEILDPFPPASNGAEPTDQGHVVGVADERSVVYSTGSRNSAHRAIVLINFDSAIRLPASAATRSNAAAAAPRRTSGVVKAGCTRRTEKSRTGLGAESSGAKDHKGGTGNEWTWEERALHLQIGKGLRLR